VLLQDRNDLLFRVPLALHRLVLSQGQTPVHPGSIQWGNVGRTVREEIRKLPPTRLQLKTELAISSPPRGQICVPLLHLEG
jgi:hypothetical protein